MRIVGGVQFTKVNELRHRKRKEAAGGRGTRAYNTEEKNILRNKERTICEHNSLLGSRSVSRSEKKRKKKHIGRGKKIMNIDF